MPHQCVRCSELYEDGAKEMLKGCGCGGKLFFFIKKEKIEEIKNAPQSRLTEKEKEQIEQDVFELVGSDIDRDAPVVLDLEAIRVSKPGKYELDIVQLFKNEPLVFRLEDGKYMIDVVQSFEKLRKK